jgi:hypothetical protein
MADLRLVLAEEELREAQDGVPVHTVTLNAFLFTGLELEEQQ